MGSSFYFQPPQPWNLKPPSNRVIPPQPSQPIDAFYHSHLNHGEVKIYPYFVTSPTIDDHPQRKLITCRLRSKDVQSDQMRALLAPDLYGKKPEPKTSNPYVPKVPERETFDKKTPPARAYPCIFSTNANGNRCAKPIEFNAQDSRAVKTILQPDVYTHTNMHRQPKVYPQPDMYTPSNIYRQASMPPAETLPQGVRYRNDNSRGMKKVVSEMNTNVHGSKNTRKSVDNGYHLLNGVYASRIDVEKKVQESHDKKWQDRLKMYKVHHWNSTVFDPPEEISYTKSPNHQSRRNLYRLLKEPSPREPKIRVPDTNRISCPITGRTLYEKEPNAREHGNGSEQLLRSKSQLLAAIREKCRNK